MIERFIDMTRRIIARDGIEAHLPTLLLPTRKDIRVLEGVPSTEDLEVASAEWAERIADPGEDFLLAFRAERGRFKVVARIDGERHEVLCDV